MGYWRLAGIAAGVLGAGALAIKSWRTGETELPSPGVALPTEAAPALLPPTPTGPAVDEPTPGETTAAVPSSEPPTRVAAQGRGRRAAVAIAAEPPGPLTPSELAVPPADPRACSITVSSVPPAVMWLDGKRMGKLLLIDHAVPCGSHKIRFLVAEPRIDATYNLFLMEGSHFENIYTLVEE